MSVEIERKFLVTSAIYREKAYLKTKIVQGYLSKDQFRTVRVRIKGQEGYITVKGAGDDSGMSRFEWEHCISVKDAEELLCLCFPGTIDKIRYNVKHGEHIIEVDEFSGVNQGLIVAEIELTHKDDFLELPEWIGEEVTGQQKYYNAQLSDFPYSEWRL
jgi:CYTH domain-containing protein